MTETPTPRPLLRFDAETGEQLRPFPNTNFAAALVVAATMLPGWPAEEIERAYGAWIEADPAPSEPYAVGSTVTHRELTTMRGTITKQVRADDGELHTVAVNWGGTITLHSPVELVEVAS